MKSVPNKLLIAGFSGAGKSTVLRELIGLAPAEFMAFLDLDVLVRGPYTDVASYVAKYGWEKFRETELNKLEEILNSTEKSVVALGEEPWSELGHLLKNMQIPRFATWIVPLRLRGRD